jgi:hypothetical protein
MIVYCAVNCQNGKMYWVGEETWLRSFQRHNFGNCGLRIGWVRRRKTVGSLRRRMNGAAGPKVWVGEETNGHKHDAFRNTRCNLGR